MGIQVIHNQNNLFIVRIAFCQKIFYFFCSINCCPPFPDMAVTPAAQWFCKDKYAAGSFTDVFRIYLLSISGPCRKWFTGFTYVLIRLFVHTDYWERRIVRFLINVENVFHGCNKFIVLLVRNTPVIIHARLKFIFLKPC